MPGKDRPIAGSGRISASAEKQTADKILLADENYLQASACADGPDQGAAYAAVSCAAARLYAMGGQTGCAAVHIAVPAGTGTGQLSELTRGAGEACRQAGFTGIDVQVCILAGDFLPRVTVFASGKKEQQGALSQPITAGSSLVMAGYAGWRGGVLLARLHEKLLTRHFSPAFLRETIQAQGSSFSPQKAVETAFASCAEDVYICGEGGIFTAIREFGEKAGLGVRVQLGDILLRQETVEICDLAGVSPYLLMSHGCVLIAARQPLQVQMQLAGADIPAAVIGYFTDDNDRVVTDGEETRYLEPFRRDSFYDSCLLITD